jgi:hypothetical protein
MAGYIFLLDKSVSPLEVFSKGVYSTRVPRPDGRREGRKKRPLDHWTSAAEGTLADYVSMRQGDHVFLFQNRKIYGVGILVNAGRNCTYQNFPDASNPQTRLGSKNASVLYTPSVADEESGDYPWLCTFKMDPGLLAEPVDMDDALASKPHAFRSLRVMEKVSFTKLDDEETRALLDVLARRNKSTGCTAIEEPAIHKYIHETTDDRDDYNLNSKPIVEAAANPDGSLKHEMALEVAVVEHIASTNETTCPIFGNWDFVTHQFSASPFKPVIYMDRIDVFGYARGQYDSITDFLIIEIKKGEAGDSQVAQLMKYVDWTAREFAGGDYSAIHAFLVAFDFDESLNGSLQRIAERGYTVGSRPAVSRVWTQMSLVRYHYDHAGRQVKFSQHPISL